MQSTTLRVLVRATGVDFWTRCFGCRLVGRSHPHGPINGTRPWHVKIEARCRRPVTSASSGRKRRFDLYGPGTTLRAGVRGQAARPVAPGRIAADRRNAKAAETRKSRRTGKIMAYRAPV